jgi:hypothetical protein
MYRKCANDFEFDLDLYNVSVDVEIKIVPLITILQLKTVYDMACKPLLGFIKYCHILINKLFKINGLIVY